MEALQSFEQWKDFLARNVQVAEAAGTTRESIIQAATRLGGLLAQSVNPANREQRLLAEMWKAGNEEEREAIASCITKMLSDGIRH